MDTEGHEVYCSMCGDGGSLVLCDSCEKSVCQVNYYYTIILLHCQVNYYYTHRGRNRGGQGGA